MIKMAVFRKIANLTFGLVIIILLNSLLVQGLGITPSRVTLKFVPNYVYEGEVCFQISGFAHLNVTPGGEFKDNIVLLNAQDESFYPLDQGCLQYKLKMPASIDKPGSHRTLIYGVEVPDETSGLMVAVVRVAHQIDIIVPYPGKYLEITDFSAQNQDAGSPVPFTLSFVNKGNETVEQARATIFVYDKDDQQVGIINTGTANNIVPDQARVLSATWDSGAYREGNYHAFVELNYDDGAKNNASTNFKLGGLDVNLVNYTREIIIGQELRKFSVIVDSIWSETVNGARVFVSVFNYSNSSEAITSFETLTRDIPPWGTETLEGYINISSLNIGQYDLKMNLSFEGITKPYDGKLSIINEPEPEKEKKSLGQILHGIFTTKVMLIILSIALIAVLIILIYVLLPRKKHSSEQQQ